jgi:DNA-binding YbaB/EbfC family protein
MASRAIVVLLIAGCCLLFSHSYLSSRAGVRVSNGVSKTSVFGLFGRSDIPKNTLDSKKGGMFGGMGDMMGALKKAQEMAKQLEQMNSELESTHITGKDTTGTVTATFNGMSKPVSIKVSDSLLAQGADAVSLAVTQALVDGYTKSQTATVGKMQELYSKAGLPMPPVN